MRKLSTPYRRLGKSAVIKQFYSPSKEQLEKKK
jgi:hypothetical protein